MHAFLPDSAAGPRQAPAQSRKVVSHLPVPLTPLVGRRHEIEKIVDLVRQPERRLITLTGPGGVGKTRLSIAAAAELEPEFADGCRYICLAPLTHADQVLPELARGLEVAEVRGQSLLECVQAALHDKEMLLVVNNFEHVADAAPLLTTILSTAPLVTTLVTSRTVLRLRGEREFAVQPLEVPATDQLAPDSPEWRGSAIELFIERARDSESQLELSPETFADIGRICARLDGLPLAIELAAARIKVLPPRAMRARLDQLLPLLVAGPHDLPAHQQTMRNAISWSHDLLSPPAKAMLRRFAVFTGGADLDAVAQVCDRDGTVGFELLDGLESLLDQHLITNAETTGDEPRFAMLETIREFGLEQLNEHGEEVRIREAHANTFLKLAEQAGESMRGPDLGRWLERLEQDHPNLRAALDWWIERGDAGKALTMTASLNRFWEGYAHLREGREWTARALALETEEPVVARGHALVGAAFLAYRLGDYDLAEREATEGLEIGRAFEHKRTIGLAHDTLGGVAYARGDYGRASEMFQQSLTVYREIGDRSEIAILLNDMGVAARENEDYATARQIHTEALELAREADDPRALAFVLLGLGVVALRTNELDEAVAHLDGALALQRVYDLRSAAKTMGYLGAAHFLKGDLDYSATLYRESLQRHRSQGGQHGIAEAISGLLRIAAVCNQHERAVRLFGAVEELRGSLGAAMDSPDHTWCQQVIAGVAGHMERTEYNSLYAEGRSLSVDAAVAEALEVSTKPAAEAENVPVDAAIPNGLLSEREIEVLRLLAEGQSDKKIADQLFISHRTVMRHVANILTKCGVQSRTAAVAFGIKHRLL